MKHLISLLVVVVILFGGLCSNINHDNSSIAQHQESGESSAQKCCEQIKDNKQFAVINRVINAPTINKESRSPYIAMATQKSNEVNNIRSYNSPIDLNHLNRLTLTGSTIKKE